MRLYLWRGLAQCKKERGTRVGGTYARNCFISFPEDSTGEVLLPRGSRRICFAVKLWKKQKYRGVCSSEHERSLEWICCHECRDTGRDVILCVSNTRWRPALCNLMDGSPPGSSVHGILQARILECAAMLSSKGFSWPRDRTHVSYVSCICRWAVYYWLSLK